jgi:hypothetical protein
MSQNIFIDTYDNPVVLSFNGIDLTQATDFEVQVGTPSSKRTIKQSETTDRITVVDPNTLSIRMADLELDSGYFELSVIYFDANSINGTVLSSVEQGNLARVVVSNVSSVVSYGTSPSNANSYVSYFELCEYCYKRNIPAPGTTADGDRVLLDAMHYLNSLDHLFQGYRRSDDQKLSWPRNGVVLYGWPLESDIVPEEIKQAQMELASYAVQNEVMTNDSNDNIKRESVGSLSVEYFEGGQRTNPHLGRVMARLSPLMRDTDKLVRT